METKYLEVFTRKVKNGYEDIPGIWYDIHNNKYMVEKTIKGNKYCKQFTQFIDAVGYLNYVLMKHNLPVIFITNVKEDILQ